MTGVPEPKRQEFAGSAASPGVALGTVWRPSAHAVKPYAPEKSAGLEVTALQEAIHASGLEVRELLATAGGSAAGILEFQLAVLSDDTFQNAAQTKIKAGQNALAAWNAVLLAEIEDYRAASEETFRAKALDLQDIQARVCRNLRHAAQQPIPFGAIVLAQNLTPTAFIAHDWRTGGIALTQGSMASHLAILARQFGVPMIINLDHATVHIQHGARVMLNVGRQNARLITAPTLADETALKLGVPSAMPFANPALPLLAGHGTRIDLMINLSRLKELDQLAVEDFDGIGLVRTEFLLSGQLDDNAFADEERQYWAYSKILEWAQGKPVFIRTIDGGGDKPIYDLKIDRSSNLRGIRLSLSNPEMFRIQIRALLRAAARGTLHVTLPMVSAETDLADTLALFEDEARKLAASGIAHTMPPIGIMVETPAVAATLERFANAAYFSIGTNDLIQYTLGQPRDYTGAKSGVESPAVLSLIKNAVIVAKTLNKPLSVCGDAASEPGSVAHLLQAGITCLSISPPSRPFVASAIRAYDDAEGA